MSYRAGIYLKVIIPTLIAILVSSEHCQAQRGHRRSSGNGWDFVAKKYDTNKDNVVSRAEYTRDDTAFELLDTTADGVLSADDWNASRRPKRGGTAPVVGDAAPDFSLTKVTAPAETLSLSGFNGQKPVALIFGSCT